MQLTIIGAREIAGGRYEPFASRVIMLEGNKSDNLVGVELYDHGAFVVTDPKIAAIAVNASKRSDNHSRFFMVPPHVSTSLLKNLVILNGVELEDRNLFRKYLCHLAV